MLLSEKVSGRTTKEELNFSLKETFRWVSPKLGGNMQRLETVVIRIQNTRFYLLWVQVPRSLKTCWDQYQTGNGEEP